MFLVVEGQRQRLKVRGELEDPAHGVDDDAGVVVGQASPHLEVADAGEGIGQPRRRHGLLELISTSWSNGQLIP